MATFGARPSRSVTFAASALVDGLFHVWGGLNEDSYRKKISVERLLSTVCRFEPNTETWSYLNPVGSPPPGFIFCTSTSAGHSLYTFGGLDSDKSCTGSLHQLDTTSLMWTELAKDGPAMKKSYCGMVEHENTLVLFGGIPSGPIQQGSEFIQNNTDGNELHSFNLKEGESCML